MVVSDNAGITKYTVMLVCCQSAYCNWIDVVAINCNAPIKIEWGKINPTADIIIKLASTAKVDYPASVVAKTRFKIAAAETYRKI